MRRRDERHPIHKCTGCLYNLKVSCALFENPKEVWDRGKCSGWNNTDLLATLEERKPEVGAALRRRLRQDEFRLRRTETHHEGNSPHIAEAVRVRHRPGRRAV